MKFTSRKNPSARSTGLSSMSSSFTPFSSAPLVLIDTFKHLHVMNILARYSSTLLLERFAVEHETNQSAFSRANKQKVTHKTKTTPERVRERRRVDTKATGDLANRLSRRCAAALRSPDNSIFQICITIKKGTHCQSLCRHYLSRNRRKPKIAQKKTIFAHFAENDAKIHRELRPENRSSERVFRRKKTKKL